MLQRERKMVYFLISENTLLLKDLLWKSDIHRRYISPTLVNVIMIIPTKPTMQCEYASNSSLFCINHLTIQHDRQMRQNNMVTSRKTPFTEYQREEQFTIFIRRRMCRKMLLNSMINAQTANPVYLLFARLKEKAVITQKVM